MNLSYFNLGRIRAIAIAAFCLLVVAPSAAHAAFPGRPGLIVFNLVFLQHWPAEIRGGLYAIRPGAKQPRQLTANPYDYDPSFAPSGKRLVFRRLKVEQQGIYTLDLRSGKTRQLTSRNSDTDPVFGRKGMVAFSRFTGDGSYDVCLRMANGRTRRLTSTSAKEGNPVFTPDGKRVVFTRDYGRPARLRAGAVPPNRIYSIRTDGTGLRLIGVQSASQLDTSPHGHRLAFETEKGVWAMPLGGGKPALVTGDASYPTYSPRGDRVAFSNRSGIWSSGADGRGRPVPLLRADYEGGKGMLAIHPTWQPLP